MRPQYLIENIFPGNDANTNHPIFFILVATGGHTLSHTPKIRYGMITKTIAPPAVESYITSFPKKTQELLRQVRATIKKAAPAAEETISYQMPAYKYAGMLVFFAGYEKHIGFYPTPSGIESFKKELAAFKTAKGSIQFPLDKPLPLALISKIVKFRMKENEAKAAAKVKQK